MRANVNRQTRKSDVVKNKSSADGSLKVRAKQYAKSNYFCNYFLRNHNLFLKCVR